MRVDVLATCVTVFFVRSCSSENSWCESWGRRVGRTIAVAEEEFGAHERAVCALEDRARNLEKRCGCVETLARTSSSRSREGLGVHGQ
jgi:hypothetical protein